MNGELPQGWTRTSLFHLVSSLRDGTHTPPKRVTRGVPLLSARNIQDGRIDFSEAYSLVSRADYENISRTNPTLDGDVLLTIVGSLGRSCVNRETAPFTLQRSVAIIRPERELIDSDYLSFYFRSPEFQTTLRAAASGTAQAGVYLNTLKSFEVALAPLAEQRRIAAVLATLLTKVEDSRKRLELFPTILKRLRQSVLSAACSGRLTEDWRRENSDLRGWVQGKLIDVAETIQIGPFGTQLHKADYVSNGIPLINPTHIQASTIIHDPKFSVSKAKLKELANYILEENDIIMGRRGEMGRCALVSQKEAGWLCGTGSLFIRPRSSISAIFLFFVLRATETKAFLENEAKGTTMSNLNLEILKTVPVPIPLRIEQDEIVRRVEALFKIADRIEARYQDARRRVGSLTQSILAKAFRGELVPQEAELAEAEGRGFESAEQLLERLRRQRNAKQTKLQEQIT
jgi:type I restriction enzyme S subunit